MAVMRYFFAVFLFCSLQAHAQLPLPCLDTLRVNPYFSCYIDYDPVCGCDSTTYRNFCFAYSKAGINHYRMGICQNELFHIDLVPNPVHIYPAQFSMAVRVPLPCYVYITDVFGAVVYNRSFYTGYADQIIRFEIDMNSFRDGVYALIALVEGEKKFVKFTKVRY
jgi:hypothetical protein